MMLTCIIIDDDQHAIDQLTEYISDTPALVLINSYADSKIAIRELLQMNAKIDILFTDVEMPNLSGIEVAKMVRGNVNILILVSAHSQYAIDGYEINANGFLSKPFNCAKFKTIVANAIQQLKQDKPSILIKNKGEKELVKIYIEDILYIEAIRNYSVIHTLNKGFITLLKLSELQQKLINSPYLIKVHKSFIVSAKHVQSIKNDYIYLKVGKSLSIGKTYKRNIEKYFALT